MADKDWEKWKFGLLKHLEHLTPYKSYLTVKSDDMQGRNETLNAIVKGKPIPRPGTPESFKVLMRELQSLGLDIGAYKIETLPDGQTRGVEVDLNV